MLASLLNWMPLLVCGALLGWLVEWLIDIWFFRRKIREGHIEVERLGKEVGTLTSANDRLGIDLKTSRDDYDGLNTRFVARNTEYDDLTTRYEGVESNLSLMTGERDNLNVRIGELDGELNTSKSTIGNYETEMQDLRAKFIERSKEVKDKDELLTGVRGELDTVRGNIADRDNRISTLEVDVANGSSEIDRLKGLVGDKDTEIDGLNVQVADLSEVNKQVGDIQGRLNTVEDENQNLRKTIGERDNELGGIRSELGIGAGAGILGALAGSRMSAEDKEEKAALETQVTTLEGELESSNAMLSSYVEATESLQGQLDVAQDAQGDADANLTWLNTYIQTSNDLQSELDEKSALLADAESRPAVETADLKPKVDELTDKVNQLEVENTSLRRTVLTRNTMLDEVRGDLGISQEDDVRASIAALQVKEAPAAEVDTGKLDELQFRIDTLDAENSALRRALLTAQSGDGNSSPSVVTKFVPAAAAGAALGAVAGGGDDESATLRNMLSDKEGEIDDLNVQLADAIEVSQQRAVELDQLSDELAEVRDELAEATEPEPDTKSGKPKRDKHKLIYGIGPAYQRRLYDAGFNTHADLCAATPEQVTAAIKPKEWQVIDAEQWIEDSCTLAAGGTPPDRTQEREGGNDSGSGSGSGYAGSAALGATAGAGGAVLKKSSSRKSKPKKKSDSGSSTTSKSKSDSGKGTGTSGSGVKASGSGSGVKGTGSGKGASGSGSGVKGTGSGKGTSGSGSGVKGTGSGKGTSGSGSGVRKSGIRSGKWVYGSGGTGRGDDLTTIYGIGPVYQERLYDAGITTYAQLAALSPDELIAIVGARGAAMINKKEAKEWIDDAGTLSKGNTPADRSSTRTVRKDDLTRIYGIGNVYQGRLYDGGINTYAGLSSLSHDEVNGIIGAGGNLTVAADEATEWTDDAYILANGGTPKDRSKTRKIERDDLTKIHGIGNVFQGRLYNGGINRYAGLASLSHDEVNGIIGAGGNVTVGEDQATEWTEDAYILAYGGELPDRSKTRAIKQDDFTGIPGIGSVYQTRLYEAGIYNYGDLSTLSAAEINEIVGADGTGVSDDEARQWRTDAYTLYTGGKLKKRSTKQAVKASGSERDNLTKISGIGKVYQGRLYDSGVYTWQSLADTSESQLTDIIKPADWQKIEPDSWKVQAAELAKKKRARGGNMPDDLKLINGIGIVYEDKLKDAGIDTFKALSKAKPDRVVEIISPEEWQDIDASAWIAEASDFVSGKKKA